MSNNIEQGLTLLRNNQPTLTQLVLVNMPKGTAIQDAERLAMREVHNLELIMNLRPELQVCEPTSIFLALKQCISDNLTLSPSAGLVYLFPGKVSIGTNPKTNAKEYKEVLMYDPTANGRLSIARQAGRILDNKRPTFTYNEKKQVTSVTVEFLVPSYPTPRWEVIIFDETYFARWKQKSAAKFGSANANYTMFNGGIDPEFAGSKAIRHGLNKLGTNTNERFNTTVAMDFKAEPLHIVNKEVKEENGIIIDVEHIDIDINNINPNDL